MLGVKIKLHADTQIQQGDIFLFNHFSRFETFIPQFLIYEQTGAYSCVIAAGEFFSEATVLANYLKKSAFSRMIMSVCFRCLRRKSCADVKSLFFRKAAWSRTIK